MGVKKVIAKASSAEHGEILEKLGAEVVYPERDMAIRLAHRLETARMLDFVQLSEKLNISKLIAPDALVGRTVAQAELRKKIRREHHCNRAGGQADRDDRSRARI